MPRKSKEFSVSSSNVNSILDSILSNIAMTFSCQVLHGYI